MNANLANSAERQQVFTQTVRVSIPNLEQDFQGEAVPFPDGSSFGQQQLAFFRKSQAFTAPVRRIGEDFDETPALQRFQSRSQRRPIHCQQRSNGGHAGRLGPIQRHEQGKLAAGDAKGTECLVETPGQSPGGALHVKTEASIANQKSCCKRHNFCA
jgi:hypothetical protein